MWMCLKGILVRTPRPVAVHREVRDALDRHRQVAALRNEVLKAKTLGFIHFDIHIAVCEVPCVM